MALRIKSHWHDDEQERTLEEVASALAFIIWRIAKDKAINLHGQDFVYEDDQQRMDVITEYLIFQLNIVDRLAKDRLKMSDADRQSLVIATAKMLAGHVQENSAEILGEGNYVPAFIEKINLRGTEYSECNYQADGPSYPFLRHLGYEMQQIMGNSQENRWVIDQIMDQDGFAIDKEIRRAVDNLFS